MQNMQEMLNKLELMLIGLKQMKTNVVFTWFPKIDKEEILRAISESPKFKIEGDVVTLKSETEMYEEELQKDILKGLMDDEEDVEVLLDYDEEIELVEASFSEENIVEIDMAKDIIEEDITITEIKEDDILENKDIDNIWANVQELANEVSGGSLKIEDFETEDISNVTTFEEVLEQDIELAEEFVAATETVCEEKLEAINEVETIVEKTIIVKDTTDLNGQDLQYNELVRLIEEYNASVTHKIETTDENKFENKEKAIVKFYENKYIVKLRESNSEFGANIFSLIHKKKGMEVAYLVVSETLNDEILNFMLDNYDDEVVYFCPIKGCEVEFEVGLNEFYLKETSKIFDRYLERYVVTEKKECTVKNLEIVIGR
ncbi:MAG: hypothetical protein RSD13_03705 [Clostridium sp.]|uniref:hypothetical protein n=1 Tax=Clostridium sp. TaxID=1506 RepID=UPI002FCBBFE6